MSENVYEYDPNVYTTFTMPNIWEDDYDEYGPSDPEYDWGYAEDGTPNPSPCPVCGVLYYACTSGNPDPLIEEERL